MSDMKLSECVDCRGTTIKLGDTIVWPVRRKSSLVLKVGTVMEKPGKGCTIKKGIVALNENGRRVILERPDRVAVVSDFVLDRPKDVGE